MIADESTSNLPVEVGEEPITGWRCWFVLPDELLLRPLVKRGLAWKPRQAMEAVCPEQIHAVPADDCKCGVWGVCHPMMLEEIHWATSPPDGLAPVPGVIIVGQIAMWGNVVQHERGWRSSYAYPTHLYAFTEDAVLAGGLRDRYGVPVASGSEAERLRRLLPAPPAAPAPRAPHAPTSPAAAVTALFTGQAWRTSYVGELVADSLMTDLNLWAFAPLDGSRRKPEAEYLKEQRRQVDRCRRRLAVALVRGRYNSQPPPFPDLRRQLRRARRYMLKQWAYVAAIDERDPLTATRIVWHGMVMRRRSLVREHMDRLAYYDAALDGYRADLERGSARRTGKPYTPSDVKRVHSSIAWAMKQCDEKHAELECFVAAPIPSYREWCAMITK